MIIFSRRYRTKLQEIDVARILQLTYVINNVLIDFPSLRREQPDKGVPIMHQKQMNDDLTLLEG